MEQLEVRSLLAADLVSAVTNPDLWGDAANGPSTLSPATIGSGARYVAFASSATNVVSGDTNRVSDVFVRDLQTGTTIRVSTDSAGQQAAGHSDSPSISTDGRWVAFTSYATGLVPSDTNGMPDIFLKDVQTGALTRISTSSTGAQGDGSSVRPILSADGQFVVFHSSSSNLVSGDTNATTDVFLKNISNGQITRISSTAAGAGANGESSSGVLDASVRYVAFESRANNLVLGDTNNASDIFVKDLSNGAIERVSTNSSGAQAAGESFRPAISADGRFVAFQSTAADLVPSDANGRTDVFVKDRQTGEIFRVSVSSSGAEGNNQSESAQISADGRYVAFISHATSLVSGDTNAQPDVFVRDRSASTTTRVNTSSSGVQGNGSVPAFSFSSDGGVVVFQSLASNVVARDFNGASDIFRRDLASGTTDLITARDPAIPGPFAAAGISNVGRFGTSGDGRLVAFSSTAANLVPSDTNPFLDVFVAQVDVDAVTRVSLTSLGAQGNNSSENAAVSANGGYAAFRSIASNLVSNDTNGNYDVFRKNLTTLAIERVSTNSSGVQGNGFSDLPALSADGRVVVFQSLATNLVTNDSNGLQDIFVKDFSSGETLRVSTSTSGAQADAASTAPAIGLDGRYVVFESNATNLVTDDTNGKTDIFRKDLLQGTLERVSTSSNGTQANDNSTSPAISADGRYVAFSSRATNLVSSDFNFRTDVFVKDMSTGQVTLVSSTASGAFGNGDSLAPVISGDGRFVAFESAAFNLVTGDNGSGKDIFVKDRTNGSVARLSDGVGGIAANGESTSPSISSDGRYISFSSFSSNLASGDGNGASDVFRVANPFAASPPSDIGLSNQSIAENAGDNALIGQLITADADAGDSFTYALVAGTGDNDNGLFTISGSELRLNNSANYEAQNQFRIRIRSTDSQQLSVEKTFVILVTNLRETFVWSGGGADDNWSTGANWVGGFAPSPGEDLVFDSSTPSVARYSNTNDFSNLEVGRITIASAATPFVLSGNEITLLDGIATSGTATSAQLLFPKITLLGTQTVRAEGSSFLSLQSAFENNGYDLNVTGAASVSFDKPISGSGGITFVEARDSRLRGNNTYGGLTRIERSFVQLSSNGTLGDGTNHTIVVDGTLGYQTAMTVDERVTLQGTSAELRGQSGAVQRGAVTLATSSYVQFVCFDGSFTISGEIGGDGGSAGVRFFPVATGQTITLSAANTYSGPTSIISSGGGVVMFGADDVVPDSSALTVSSGATLNLNNFGDRVGSLAGDGIVRVASTPFYFGGNANSTIFAGTIQGFNQLIKEGTGTFTLTGSITGGGGFIVNDGTLRLGASNRIEDTRALSLGRSATLDLNGFSETIYDVTDSTGSRILLGSGTLTVGPGRSASWFGTVSGTGGLTVLGPQTLTIERSSTYTGPTTVRGGSLLVNGSLGNSAVQVSNSVLGGSGSIAGTVTIASGGILAPGNGTGRLRTGSLTMTSGSTLQLDIGGVDPRAPAFDQLVVVGSVDIERDVTLRLASANHFNPSTGDVFQIVDNDGDNPADHRGVFSGLPDGAVISRFLGSANDAVIRYQQNGNDVQITVLDRNQLPTIEGPLVSTTDEDADNYSTSLLAGARDPNSGDVLEIANLTLVSGDARGISINGDQLTVAPAAYDDLRLNERASVVYSYDIVDGRGGAVSQTITINVDGRDDGPVPVDPIFIGGFWLVNVYFDETLGTLSGEATLPLLNAVQFAGTVQDGQYDLSSNVGSADVLGFSVANVVATLANTGAAMSGDVELPLVGSIDLSGSLNPDGTFELLGSKGPTILLGGLVELQSPAVTVTPDGYSLFAAANVADLGEAEFRGLLFADGSYSVDAHMDVSIAGFSVANALLVLDAQQLEVGFEMSVPGVGDVAFEGSYGPGGQWSLSGTYPGPVTIGPVVLTDLSMTLTNESLTLGALATLAGIEAFVNADTTATIYYDGRFQAEVDADVLELGGFRLGNAVVTFGNDNVDREYIVTVQASAGIPSGPEVALEGEIREGGIYRFTGSQDLTIVGLTLAEAQFTLDNTTGFTFLADWNYPLFTAEVNGTIASSGATHFEGNATLQAGGFTLANIRAIVDVDPATSSTLIALAGTSRIPLLGDVDLQGVINSPTDYQLTGTLDAKIIGGLRLTNVRVTLTNNSFSIQATAPLLGEVKLSGFITDDTHYSLSGSLNSRTIGGISLSKMSLSLSQAGASGSFSLKATAPLLGEIDVSGSITDDTHYSLSGKLASRPIAGLSLTEMKLSLSQNGPGSGSFSLGASAVLLGSVTLTGSIQDDTHYSLSGTLKDQSLGISLTSLTLKLSQNGANAGAFSVDATAVLVGKVTLTGQIVSSKNYSLTGSLEDQTFGGLSLTELSLSLSRTPTTLASFSIAAKLPVVGTTTLTGTITSSTKYSLTGTLADRSLGSLKLTSLSVTLARDGGKSGSFELYATAPLVGSVTLKGKMSSSGYELSGSLKNQSFGGISFTDLTLNLELVRTRFSVRHVFSIEATAPVVGEVTLKGSITDKYNFSLSGSLQSQSIGNMPLASMKLTLSRSGTAAGSFAIEASAALFGSVELTGSISSATSYSLSGSLENRTVGGLSLTDMTLYISRSKYVAANFKVTATAPLLGSLSLKGTVTDRYHFTLTSSVASKSIGGLSLGSMSLTLSRNGTAAGSFSLYAEAPLVGSTTLTGWISSKTSYGLSGTLTNQSFGGLSLTNLTLSLGHNGSTASFGISAENSLLGKMTLSGWISGRRSFEVTGSLSKTLFGVTLKKVTLSNNGFAISASFSGLGTFTLDGYVNSASDYRLTASVNDVTIGGYTFGSVSVTLSNSGLKVSGSVRVAGVTISVSLDSNGNLKVSSPVNNIGGAVGGFIKDPVGTIKSCCKIGNGIVAGSTVFFDVNKNGELDSWEAWGYSNSLGQFDFPITSEFDVNGNSMLDDSEGQWVAIGGIDISTGLPSVTPLSAPGSWQSITPLTNLVTAIAAQGSLTIGEATRQVLLAMNLPPIDLATFDMAAAVLAGDPNGQRVYAAHARLQDSIAQIASLFSGDSETTKNQILDSVAGMVATASSRLDLGSAMVIADIVVNVAGQLNTQLSSELISGAAAVIAATNQQIDAVTAPTSVEYWNAVAQIKRASQELVAADLTKVAAGETTVDTMVAENTGAALAERIAANVVRPVVVAPYVLITEATSGQGARVTFDVNAHDTVGQTLSTSVSHPSGSLFPLGDTTVLVSTVDAFGVENTVTMLVRVVDTVAPELLVQDEFIFEQNTVGGAIIELPAVMVTDAVDANPSISFDLAAGLFPLGATLVTVTAADSSGNSNSRSFTIRVVDGTPPTLQLPDNITVEADELGGASVLLPEAIAEDLVDPQPSITYDPPLTSFPLGTTVVTVTATDSADNSTSGSFTVTVVDTTPPDFVAPEIVVEATSADGASVTNFTGVVKDVADPSPLVILNDSTISVFPLGSTIVTATARDASGNTSTAEVTIRVVDTTGPELIVPGQLIVRADSPEGATVVLPTITATDSVDPQPAVSIDLPNGFFPLGTTFVTVTASDVSGNTTRAVLAVTVVPDLAEPTVVPRISGISGNRQEGIPIELAAEAIDSQTLAPVSGATIHWSVFREGITQPLAGNSGPDLTTFSFTPDDDGVYRVVVAVSDTNGNITSAETAVVVENANPEAGFSYAIVDSPAGRVIELHGTANDPGLRDQQSDFTYSWRIMHGDQVLAETTDLSNTFSFAPGAPGEYSVQLTVSDKDGASDTAEEVISINPPVALDVNIQTLEDASVTGALNVTDADDDSLTYELGTPALNGEVILQSDGTFVYVPFSDFHGDDQFTYRARDAHDDSNTATVFITVSPLNDTPVAVAAETATTEDAVIAGQLTATDLDGDSVTFQLLNPPRHGELTLDPDGSYRYTPDADFFGDDSFTYIALDGITESLPETVLLSISPVNDRPVVFNSSLNAAEDGARVTSIVLADDLDPEDDALSLQYILLSTSEEGSVLVNGDGTFSFTPGNSFQYLSAGQKRIVTFTFQAVDQHGAASDPGTVTITVAGENDQPLAANDDVQTFEDAAVSGDVLTNDTDGDASDSLSVVALNGNRTHVGQTVALAHGTIVINANGTFTYQPGSMVEATSDSFSYTIRDGKGGESTATVNIEIRRYRGVQRNAGILRVGGGETADSIYVQGSQLNVNGQLHSLDGINELRIWGRGGDDQIDLTGLPIPAFIHGGQGNDRAVGGVSNDVIIGGDGDDLVTGESGNDFLVGGNGKDRIIGSAGHDVLISGLVAFHLDLAALREVSRRWANSRQGYEQMVDDAIDEMVGMEGSDVLTGSSGADLFIISAEDKVTDFQFGKPNANKDGDVVIMD